MMIFGNLDGEGRGEVGWLSHTVAIVKIFSKEAGDYSPEIVNLFQFDIVFCWCMGRCIEMGSLKIFGKNLMPQKEVYGYLITNKIRPTPIKGVG